MKNVTRYGVLLFIAYGFYMLLGLTWFLVTLLSGGGRFNYTAFSIFVIFAVQAYYRHRLTNLVLGILSLGYSIFMLLDVINSFDLMAKDATYDSAAKVLLGLSLSGMIMAGILIFGYTNPATKE